MLKSGIVYSYYSKWADGNVGVRDEVRRQSRNTAYVFALISYYIARDLSSISAETIKNTCKTCN